MSARFGPFSLHPDRRQLLRDGAIVHLTPKAFDLLQVLVIASPRVMPKQELHERVWPGVFVSEASLTSLIKELRRALGDEDPERPIIRTVHRIGYALGLEVQSELHAAPETLRVPSTWHWLAVPNRRIVLHGGDNVVGRDPGCDVWLEAPGVSRRHARILVDGAQAHVEDLGSKNGTTVGDARIETIVALGHGDRIRFGSVVAIYGNSTGGVSTETHGPDALGPSDATADKPAAE